MVTDGRKGTAERFHEEDWASASRWSVSRELGRGGGSRTRPTPAWGALDSGRIILSLVRLHTCFGMLSPSFLLQRRRTGEVLGHLPAERLGEPPVLAVGVDNQHLVALDR